MVLVDADQLTLSNLGFFSAYEIVSIRNKSFPLHKVLSSMHCIAATENRLIQQMCKQNYSLKYQSVAIKASIHFLIKTFSLISTLSRALFQYI